MNQIRKPAMPDGSSSVDDRRRNSIEYDDGNPATVVPHDDRGEARNATRGTARAAMSARCYRSPLAEIERGMTIEYDDGNPATIAAGA
jgi:hypothetical protein